MSGCLDLSSALELVSVREFAERINKEESNLQSFVRLFYYLRNKGLTSELENEYSSIVKRIDVLRPIQVLGEGLNCYTLNQEVLSKFVVRLTIHSVVSDTGFSSNRVKVVCKGGKTEKVTGIQAVRKVLEPCYKRSRLLDRLSRGCEAVVLCQKWFVTLKVIKRGSISKLHCLCRDINITLNKKQLSFLGIYKAGYDYFCGELNFFLTLLDYISGGSFDRGSNSTHIKELLGKLSDEGCSHHHTRCPEFKSESGYYVQHNYKSDHYFGSKYHLGEVSELCICERKSVYDPLWYFLQG